jgi:hypothetical protein
MKKIRGLLFLSGLVLLLNTCNKDEDSPAVIEYNAEPTPVGTETGSPSFGTIGPEGGSLNSSDGKLVLRIPAGALSSVTQISILPVTNNAPGGRGNAYRFGPEGTKLNEPATLTFHYTDNDVSGSLPMFLGMAVQYEDQIWHNLGNPVLDTINKTISITTKRLFPGSQGATSNSKKIQASNFMDHATFLDLYIFPEAAELKRSESQVFHVYAIENHPGSAPVNEDDLPPLPKNHKVSPDVVKQWLVNGIPNGNSEYGIAKPNGDSCTYTAPDAVPSRNPVDLSANIKLWYKDPATGKDFNNLKINAPITITGIKKEYQLKISLKWDNWGTYVFNWNLTDLATMDVVVTDGIVSISNIKNNNGTISPTTQSKVIIQGVRTCTGTVDGKADSTGLLNITSGKGQVLFNDLDPNSPWLELRITNSNGMWPKIKYECTGDQPAFEGGTPYPGSEYYLRFVLTDEIQTKNETPIVVTLTPKSLLPD